MIESTDADKFVENLHTLVTKNLANTKGKDVILLMGGTGNGKSTFLNMIVGSKIMASKNKRGVWQMAANPQVAMIGHHEAMTFVPNYWENNGLRIYDCPGFNDNRSIEHEIGKSIFIKEIADNAKSIKIIVVGDIQSFQSTRGGPFRNCLDQLKDFIPGFDISSDYSLVVTKAESDSEPQHIQQFFKEDLKTEMSEKLITMVYRPYKAGDYDYSYLDFKSIIAYTPTISSKCNIPLSAQAKLQLINLSRELNKSVEKAIKAFSQALRIYYLQVLAHSLDVPNAQLQQILSLFEQVKNSIKDSQSPQQFLKNINKYSRKLQHRCFISFKFTPFYEFIDKKLKQIAFLKEKIGNFEVCIEDWIKCFILECECFEKSSNEAELKNIDSFTSFLKDTVNIDISKDIRTQAHAYLIKTEVIYANYSGSKLVSGSVKKSDKCIKKFNIPYSKNVIFQDNISYKGTVRFYDSKTISGSVTVQSCSCGNGFVNRCWACEHYNKEIPYSKSVSCEGFAYYSGTVYYKGNELITGNKIFSREADFSVSKPYNETVNFNGSHTAYCSDHHRCSCEHLANIAFSAKELFEDIQCYKRIAAAQRKEMLKLGKKCEGEALNGELAVAKEFNVDGFRVSDKQATLKDITNRIHDTLSQTHTFSAPYNGSVNIKIEKPYCQNVRFQGLVQQNRQACHKADVSYNGVTSYNEQKHYSGSTTCHTCYMDCSWCNSSSYEKSYSGSVNFSGYKPYSGTVSFYDQKSISISIPYDEIVPNVGVIQHNQCVNYQGYNQIKCQKDNSVGKGHHNCDSCTIWQKFVNALKSMIEVKMTIISQIKRNNQILQVYSPKTQQAQQ